MSKSQNWFFWAFGPECWGDEYLRIGPTWVWSAEGTEEPQSVGHVVAVDVANGIITVANGPKAEEPK